ncbi:MAG TPA: twin-arginine translocation signal domain-containing protein [Acidimicrobiales bacterium]
MPGLSRRSFLTKSSLVLAAGSVATAVPGLGSILEAAPAEAPEIEGAASEGEAAAGELTGPFVAHITDLRSGEISFYEGERQVILKDPGLAARLYRASR